MRRVARIERHPRGPRVYVAGRRVHHGAAGLLAIAAAIPLRNRRRVFGALLILGGAGFLHDRRDFPFRDTDNH